MKQMTRLRLLAWTLGIATSLLFLKSMKVSNDFLSHNEIRNTASMPAFGNIPNFSLTERSGRTFNSSELKGKLWIADFVFTHCAGPCPLISGEMKRLQEQFKGRNDIRLVSFSVDPERDTPEVLSAYADRYGADPARWIFLTGEKAHVFDIIQRYFHLGVSENIGDDLDPVAHSTKFVLVDTSGQIRGYYDSQDRRSINAMIHHTEILRKQPDQTVAL